MQGQSSNGLTQLIVIAVLVISSFGEFSWWKIGAIFLVLLIAFILYLYFYQEQLLFQPCPHPQYILPCQNPEGFRDPAEYDIPYENLYFTTPDHFKLHAWLLKQKDASKCPTILWFHANAANMGFRMPNLVQLYHKCNVNIFIFSYRGYGESQGTPTEHGVCLDAETAWKELCKRTDIDPNNVFFFGRSLGGAVALSLLAGLLKNENHKIRGVVLENTFSSISEMVDSVFPYLRYVKTLILRLRFPSKDWISSISTPMLFVSGQQDELVPPTQMQSLFDAAGTKDKTMATFQGTHNDTWLRGGEAYWQAWNTFIRRLALFPVPTPAAEEEEKQELEEEEEEEDTQDAEGSGKEKKTTNDPTLNEKHCGSDKKEKDVNESKGEEKDSKEEQTIKHRNTTKHDCELNDTTSSSVHMSSSSSASTYMTPD
eukprot:TRINITY_DN1572_c5_g1_i1.p1 TRINITY_DN1572_c5_g1~~TRINITY_DN1572_c5_g1_i1.p1  ORF type:complete len:444 (+),score=100.23 TRINITY_DN1572_c5_g1_i1:54-1334(+)